MTFYDYGRTLKLLRGGNFSAIKVNLLLTVALLEKNPLVLSFCCHRLLLHLFLHDLFLWRRRFSSRTEACNTAKTICFHFSFFSFLMELNGKK